MHLFILGILFASLAAWSAWAEGDDRAVVVRRPALQDGQPLYTAPAEPAKRCSDYDLFRAVENGAVTCLVRALKNMDVNEVDQRGDTPLHRAIRARKGLAIVYLVKHGADLHALNYDFQTPKALAESLGFRRLTAALDTAEFETTRLWRAIDDQDLVKVLATVNCG